LLCKGNFNFHTVIIKLNAVIYSLISEALSHIQGSVIAQQGYNFPRRQSTILLELSEMCTHLFNRRRSLLSYFHIKSNVAEHFIVFDIFFIRGEEIERNFFNIELKNLI
jgi:hypothetical protein